MARPIFQASGPGVSAAKPNTLDALKPLTEAIAAGLEQRRAKKQEDARFTLETISKLASTDPELAATVIDNTPDEVFTAAGMTPDAIKRIRDAVGSASASSGQPPAAGQPAATVQQPAATSPAAPANPPTPQPLNVRQFRPRTATEQAALDQARANVGETQANTTLRTAQGVEAGATAGLRNAQAAGARGDESRAVAEETRRAETYAALHNVDVQTARLQLQDLERKNAIADATMMDSLVTNTEGRTLTEQERNVIRVKIAAGEEIPAKFRFGGKLEQDIADLERIPGVSRADAVSLIVDPIRNRMEASKYEPQIQDATLRLREAQTNLAMKQLEVTGKALEANGTPLTSEMHRAIAADHKAFADAGIDREGVFMSRNPGRRKLLVNGHSSITVTDELQNIFLNGTEDDLVAHVRAKTDDKTLTINDLTYLSPGDMTAEKQSVTMKGTLLASAMKKAQLRASEQDGAINGLLQKGPIFMTAAELDYAVEKGLMSADMRAQIVDAQHALYQQAVSGQPTVVPPGAPGVPSAAAALNTFDAGTNALIESQRELTRAFDEAKALLGDEN